jgi:predicted enzyme related to lactoylglutathione lyase
MPAEPGAINGGLMKRKHPINSPLIIIRVQKIDDAMKKVEKTGGKIIRGKIQVGDMGYSAYFKDTEGNIIGLWEAIR